MFYKIIKHVLKNKTKTKLKLQVPQQEVFVVIRLENPFIEISC